MKVVPLRLQPGDDLRQTLEAWLGEQQEQAGCLICAVGSLSVAQLRLAAPTCTWPSQAAAARCSAATSAPARRAMTLRSGRQDFVMRLTQPG